MKGRFHHEPAIHTHTLATLIDKGKRFRHLNLIIAAVLLTFTLASVVQASTTPTTYYACVNYTTGSIRMTTATGTCLSKEQMISWNNIGQQGPQGPAGPAGPIGPAGP